MAVKDIVIVTGVAGQDGSYLSEILIERGYRVVGLTRRSSTNQDYDNLRGVINSPDFKLEFCDITDPSSVFSCIKNYQPFALFNLAAQSHVKVSFEQPIYTLDVDAKAVINVLEGIRLFSPQTRMYQASTSEMFGSNVKKRSVDTGKFDLGLPVCFFQFYQDETTEFSPNSPYAVAKVAAHQMCEIYRKSYGLHISCGILFNHESPRRGIDFVTRKVTDYVGRLCNGKANTFLELGNMKACRDWGYAKEYMEAALSMVLSDKPDTFVVATGETHSIESLCYTAFSCRGFDWQEYVKTNPQYNRPLEVPHLLGDSSKIKNVLGWQPKVKFKELIEMMVDSDANKYSNN